MSDFTTELKARLTLPTPRFWRKLQKRTAATSAALTATTVSLASVTGLPPIIPQVFGWIAAFFGGIAAICFLAVNDADAAQLPSNTPNDTTPGTT